MYISVLVMALISYFGDITPKYIWIQEDADFMRYKIIDIKYKIDKQYRAQNVTVFSCVVARTYVKKEIKLQYVIERDKWQLITN